MDNTYLKISGLQKIYKMGEVEVKALAGVDLTIPPRSFTLIMGPSGSGKSTLLYLVGGLDRPTYGQIFVEGREVDNLDENELAVYRRKMVGFIFQSFNLIPSMTALENVALPLRFTHTRRRERFDRARELLKKVGLEDRAQHRPTELSGGQQQRVAIARALVNQPHLILADEPTGNLDTASGESIMELLAELHGEGATVMVVSHDTRLVNYATQVVQILDGRIADGIDGDEPNSLAGQNSPDLSPDPHPNPQENTQ
ncbi:MAG TPA: ABC transporter ATP-binding protein [Anaerolineales bacterium]|nr:ABC transporter ATP-binding protein [Anaerolineales bacterium]